MTQDTSSAPDNGETVADGSKTDARALRTEALVRRIGEFWTFGVFVLLVIGFTIANPAFFSQASWLSISVFATSLLLATVGQAFVIITGGIDLSIGAVVAFSAMLSALAMRALGAQGLSDGIVIGAGAVTALVGGLVFGLLNGLIITKVQLTPFIATLGTMGIATGGTLLLNNGLPIYEVPDALADFGNARLLDWIAMPVLVTTVICIVGGIVLHKLRFGRHVFAMGSSEEAARRSGIRGDRVLIKVYAIAGFTAGVAGFLLVARFGMAHPTFGSEVLLSSIAAVVIGGASLSGGRGSIFGAVVGGMIISILLTGLMLAGAAPFWQTFAVGVAILVAVYVDQLRLKVRDR